MVDWLQLGQTGGTGDAYVLVQVPDNVSLIERNTTLTVSGFTKHATINVTQQGFEPELIVSPTELTAANTSGVTTLHITANTAYRVYSKPNWVSLGWSVGTSGVTSVTATVAANTGTTQRSGDIVWECDNFPTVTASTHVTQSAATPYFTISPTVINRSSDSGTSIVRITTNGTWEIVSSSSWFSVAPSSGNSSSTGFTLTFNENQTAADLTGSVVVKYVQTDTPYTVNVTQSSARTVGIVDCVYSITSTTRATQLYYDEGNIVFMEVDGGTIEPASSAVTFSTTGLHNVKFYLNNTQIMDGQFVWRPLVSVNLTNIDTLSSGSFGWCNLLTGFTSSTITRIDTGSIQPGSYGTPNPFEESSALTEFHGSSSNVIMNGKGFVVGDKLYSLAAGYTSFDTSDLPSGINKLGGGCLSQNWNSMLSVHIDSNVTELDRLAFYYLPYLTAATFSSSTTITVIPDMCFFGCHHLTSAIVPDSVVRVDEMAFAECFRLTAVTFGASVQYIDYGQNMAPGNATTFSPIKSITCKSITAPTISNVVGYPSFFIRSAAPNSGGNKNGTVHYPSGADYSSWENSEPFASDGTWTFVADA